MSRAVTIWGFVALFAMAAAFSLYARLHTGQWVRFRAALTATCRTRWARGAVLFVWAWLGWHFLAR